MTTLSSLSSQIPMFAALASRRAFGQADTHETVHAGEIGLYLEGDGIVEALGIDPADAAPDYWRHVHSRLAVGEALRPYTMARHKAWLLRQRLES